MHILSADAVYDSIVSILVSDHGIKESKISRNSKIPTELGVDGADAWELVEKMQAIWHIDLQIDFYEHFGPESAFFQRNPAEPMTVGQLANLVIAACSRRTAE
jgi:hypothetical protein